MKPTIDTILCKFRGMLVLMEVTKGKEGRCPDCGNTKFTERNGWIECDCGFAINKTNYKEITK